MKKNYLVALLLAGVHLAVGVRLAVNQVSHRAIVLESESFHLQYYAQFADGGHNYYPRGAIRQAVSDTYVPLAAQCFGAVMRWVGRDVRIVRAARIAVGLGALALMAWLVGRLTGRASLSCLAVGLGVGIEPGWFFNSGPNPLHVGLALLGIGLLLPRSGQSPRERLTWPVALGATLAFFGCYWTKQTGLAYWLAALAYLLVQDWRKGVAAVLFSVALGAGSAWWFIRKPDADFVYWVFQTNTDQPLIWSRLWDPIFFPVLAGRFAVALALMAAFLLVARPKFRELFHPLWIFLGAAAFVGCLTGLKYGSGQSQSWLFYALMIVGGLYAAHELETRRAVAPTVLGVLLAMQALSLAQDHRPLLLTDEDDARFDRLLGMLADPQKKTLYVDRPYFNILAGRPVEAIQGEGCYVKGVFTPEIYPAAYREFFARDPFDVVIVDIPPPDGFFPLYERLNTAYRLAGEFPAAARFSDAGALRRKKAIFVRK